MKKVFNKKQIEKAISSRAYSFDDMLNLVGLGSSYEIVHDRKNKIYIFVDLYGEYEGYDREIPDAEELELRNFINQNPERFDVFPFKLSRKFINNNENQFKEWAREHMTEDK